MRAVKAQYLHWKKELQQLVPFQFFVYICSLNFMIYVERGIIPGANKEFVLFIKEDLGTSSPDTYVGILQSAFIIGLAITCPLIAHAIHIYNARKLVASGLFVWGCAVLGSAVAGWVGSYPLLVTARVLSGVGEASFICIAPPFILRNAQEKRGRWMAVYYLMLPIGTAAGFAFGGVFGNTVIGWTGCYTFISICAFIYSLVFCFIPDDFVSPHTSDLVDETPKDAVENSPRMSDDIELSHVEDSPTKSLIEREAKVQNILKQSRNDDYGRKPFSAQPPAESYIKPDVTFMKELRLMSTSPIFWCLVCFSASYAAAVQALSTFASPFLIFLGYYGSETIASLTLGIILATTSILGTLLGGWLSDISLQRAAAHSQDELAGVTDKILINNVTFESYLQVKTLGRLTFLLSLVGCVFLIVVFAVKDYFLFMLLVIIGLIFIFATQAPGNMILMLCVPVENRAFSIAAATLLQHVLGDVPFVIIIGYIKDKLAPHCIFESDQVELTPECIRESHGIRSTMLVVTSWMLWMAIGTFACWIISTRITKKAEMQRLNENAPIQYQLG